MSEVGFEHVMILVYPSNVQCSMIVSEGCVECVGTCVRSLKKLGTEEVNWDAIHQYLSGVL